MQLFVKSQNLHVLDVTGHETVGDIKHRVAALDGLVADDVAVYCAGRPMEDGDVLALCAADLATLDVEVRMLGGR
jgi:small subunit ribosomal protein S30e